MMRLARAIVVAAIVLPVVVLGVLPASASATSCECAGPVFTYPVVDGESASQVTSSDATLEATITPGVDQYGVYYQFQLVASPSEFVSTFACPPEWARSSLCLGLDSQVRGLPIGEVPYLGGIRNETVRLDLASAGVTLTPGSIYFYRVITARRIPSVDTIAWEEPIVLGPDKTFVAPAITPRGGPPVIESESFSHLTSTDATLEATLNDQGLEASYEFHLVSVALCRTATPPCEVPDLLFSTPPGKLTGSSASQSVSVDLNSVGIKLSPGFSYWYWLSATSAAGTTEGAHEVLTKPPEPVAPPPPITSGTGTGGTGTGTAGTGTVTGGTVTGGAGTPPGPPLTTPKSQGGAPTAPNAHGGPTAPNSEQTGPGNDARGGAPTPAAGVKGVAHEHRRLRKASKMCKRGQHGHRASCVKQAREKRRMAASPVTKH
jgi:hypothetical protein